MVIIKVSSTKLTTGHKSSTTTSSKTEFQTFGEIWSPQINICTILTTYFDSYSTIITVTIYLENISFSSQVNVEQQLVLLSSISPPHQQRWTERREQEKLSTELISMEAVAVVVVVRTHHVKKKVEAFTEHTQISKTNKDLKILKLCQVQQHYLPSTAISTFISNLTTAIEMGWQLWAGTEHELGTN